MTLIDKTKAHDHDLIRRGDALTIVARDRVFTNRTGSEFRVVSTQDMLKAIAALPAVTVGVKPLVWRSNGKGRICADTPFGLYEIEHGRYGMRLLHSGSFMQDDLQGIDAAKAAAQADYEARIRAALEPVAAPEVMNEDAPAAIIREIGNQIHNLGCDLQNDEDVSLRLSDLAIRLWDAAKMFSTEPVALTPTAVDVSQPADPAVNAPDPAAIREAAMKIALMIELEAALPTSTTTKSKAEAVEAIILALIQKGAADDR